MGTQVPMLGFLMAVTVRAHVVYPRGAGERGIAGEVQVEFRIGREGRIECVALLRSSGGEGAASR
jgi:outer membrane biosynthesis protein TonB